MRRLLTTTAILLSTAMALPAAARQDPQASRHLSEACNTSWLSVDADKNGKISQSEADNYIDIEFKRIDIDDNDTISVKEWKACATPAVAMKVEPAGQQKAGKEDETAAGGESQPQWMQKDFASLDTDKSGDISASEAAKAGKADASVADVKDAQQAVVSASRFAAIDSDRNGKVSKQEWGNRAAANMDASYKALDEDGDGKVNKNEFSSYREQRFGQAQQAQGDQPTVWYYYFYTL